MEFWDNNRRKRAIEAARAIFKPRARAVELQYWLERYRTSWLAELARKPWIERKRQSNTPSCRGALML